MTKNIKNTITVLCIALSCNHIDTFAQEYSKYLQAVDEYQPAPGQFVNELPEYELGDDAAAMAAKCTESLTTGGMISLGGFGGYITFHFDHSISNVPSKRDLYISGNGYNGNSEPGIVMVMRDDNANGQPDDTWYELAGSADTDSIGKVIYNYSITYTPNPMGNIPWTDNQGNSGEMKRIGYHQQEYFPAWIDTNLTFTGTRLPNNATNKGTDTQPYYFLTSLRYGYVDNASRTDTTACSFDISWAVDAERRPVTLDRIDFVRVYCAVNQQCGWIGETSTEITGAEDLHLTESLQSTAISSPIDDNADHNDIYSLSGHRRPAIVRGLNIIRNGRGEVRKVVVR